MAIEDDIRKLLEPPRGLTDLLRLGTRAGRRRGGHEEREARHEAEGLVVSAVADALEARHRGEQAREDLERWAKKRQEDGFRDDDGDHNVAYDFAAFGMHTLKTFLELNARANQKVVAALRDATRAADEGRGADAREPREQPMKPVRLSLGHRVPAAPLRDWASKPHIRLGDFEIVNRRGGRLAIRFPDEVTFRAAAGDTEVTLALDFVPRKIDLEPGQMVEVFVDVEPGQASRLSKNPDARTWLADVPLEGEHGRHAPMVLVLATEKDAQTVSDGVGVEIEGRPITGDVVLFDEAGEAIEARVKKGEVTSAAKPVRGRVLAWVVDADDRVGHVWLDCGEGLKVAKSKAKKAAKKTKAKKAAKKTKAKKAAKKTKAKKASKDK